MKEAIRAKSIKYQSKIKMLQDELSKLKRQSHNFNTEEADTDKLIVDDTPKNNEDQSQYDIVKQFFTKAKSPTSTPTPITNQTTKARMNMNISSRSIFLATNEMGDNNSYGRAIIDNGADTGSMPEKYTYVDKIYDMKVNVGGAIPNKCETYKLCDGITAIDLHTGTILIGQREVALIPNSYNMLISESQCRSYGTEIDSKPRRFGGKGYISTLDGADIKFYLERSLLTCPIRKPTRDEIKNLHVHWITGELDWNPAIVDETINVQGNEILPWGYKESLFSEMEEEENQVDCCDEEMTDDVFKTVADNDVDDAFLLYNESNHKQVEVNLTHSNRKIEDVEKLKKYFLWRPSDIITKTLAATTQWAMTSYEPPLQRHFKSRFPVLNRNRLQETFCTDTWFGNEKAIGGFTCAQIFCGMISKYIAIYPMKKESDGPDALEDFIRYQGAPIKIKSDNAQMEIGKAWTMICRKYNIEQCTTEPNYQWQNNAERYIGEIKKYTSTIMDRVGSPNQFWVLCAKYIVYILNRMSHPLLEDKTPFERCFGITPDISAIMHHTFYDKVYYLENETSFPESKERLGRFVGIAENCGDALTYLIYDEETNKVIARSVIRTTNIPNNRIENLEQLEINNNQDVRIIGHDDIFTSNIPMSIIDPTNHDGYTYETENNETQMNKYHLRSRINNKPIDNAKDIYMDIINKINKKQEEGETRWRFKKILDHQNSKDGKGIRTELKILWDDNSISWEPLEVFKIDDPISVATYARKEKLLDMPTWKWCKKYIEKRRLFTSMTRHIFTAKGKATTRYQFGVRVPKSVKEAIEFDKQEGNNLWRDAMKEEMDKIEEYKVFIESKNIPSGYIKIPCHMVFAVKFDGRF